MYLFFELLQVALGTRDKLSRVPTPIEWASLYDEAERQAVVGVLLSGLEQLPEEQLSPLEVKLQWIGEVQMMEAEYRLHCDRASELTSRFRAVGFKSCILKGVGFAQMYPHPEWRQCGDIDIWVDGRREDVLAWLRTQCEVGYSTWHHTDAMMFEDVPVEVHFRPSWVYHPLQNRRLQRWFKEHGARVQGSRLTVVEFATPRHGSSELGSAHGSNADFKVPGGEITTPTVEFDAVFALTHAFHHLLEEGVGFRHIVDYFYVLKSLPLTAYSEVLRTIKDIGLGKFASAMMWVLKEACGATDDMLICEPYEKEGRFLLSEIKAAGNFGFNRVGEELKHNSLKRYWVMGKHYPGQVLWMIPFKVRNKVWMMIHK